ncbi:hypothetical protein OH492_28140 [Vibrio chagasii]|nr:hypothetical protein [Vibrio chagasii]
MFVVIIFIKTDDDSNLYHWQATVERRNFTVLSTYSTTLTEANVSGIEKWIEGRINVVNAAKRRVQIHGRSKKLFHPKY